MCRKRILDPGLVGRFIFQGALDIDWVFNTANPGSPGLDFKNSIKGNLLLIKSQDAQDRDDVPMGVVAWLMVVWNSGYRVQHGIGEFRSEQVWQRSINKIR